MLNCVDLFAGAGGFSLAAKEVGFKLRLAIENDGHAVKTYKSNLCEGKKQPLVREGDITGMVPRELYDEVFESHEHCDLLLGGPPCQGFSTHRIKDAGVEDLRNELIHIYFEFVRIFSPSVFLMENVPGMLWPRHKPYVDKFYAQAKKAGYFLFDPVILDARDFGVPQRRKRVFLLGLRQDVSSEGFIWPPQRTHGNKAAREKQPELKPWNNCKSVFVAAPPKDPNDIHMKHGSELTEAFKKTPANGGSRVSSGRTLKCHVDYPGHKDVYGRINPSHPGPTITTACINPSKGRFVHPVQHHGITVRHAARLQTFPDTYVFEGGLTAAGKQVGNAVPVQLGVALIDCIKSLLVKSKQTERNEAPKRRQKAA